MEEVFKLHRIELPGIVDGLLVAAERTSEEERFTCRLREWNLQRRTPRPA
jgi:hypothetical protein